jgi:hypothetical protein
MRLLRWLGFAIGLGTFVAWLVYLRGNARPTERGILHPRLRQFTIERLNPFLLERGLAGGGRPWAVLVHHGRVSGRVIETPVIAEPVEGGFVVPLPYGVGVDWMRNLQAAGGGQIRFLGETVAIEAPTVVELPEAAAELRPGEVAIWRLMGIGRVAFLARATVPPAPIGDAVPVADEATIMDEVAAPAPVTAAPPLPAAVEAPVEPQRPASEPEVPAAEPTPTKRPRRRRAAGADTAPEARPAE